MGSSFFLDSNVILDFLLDRDPFNFSADEIFEKGYNKNIHIFFSSLTVANIHYLLRKQYGNDGAINKIAELFSFCKILPVTEKEILAAIKSGFSDFEEAIQYFTAIQNSEIKGIITRNLSVYKKSKIPVFSPESFLSIFK
ncbi:type II toxin-antitoxin system VapC family toxin [Algoriphagus boritolerans]|uniref:PIN domain-containing protein n=1 Tax=Algoriphagus boritolerans DSM 17298 = JCM 18970 TaxID=1120964 RepID=A0A1H5VYG2_9BACT|nr:PIN domain-containing protein [Algoriphagus boritolerans]SEF91597.1 PIN domain-containing protein [Algoriphagus boritolerans DSM 17298 = JCM 18970]